MLQFVATSGFASGQGRPEEWTEKPDLPVSCGEAGGGNIGSTAVFVSSESLYLMACVRACARALVLFCFVLFCCSVDPSNNRCALFLNGFFIVSFLPIECYGSPNNDNDRIFICRGGSVGGKRRTEGGRRGG